MPQRRQPAVDASASACSRGGDTHVAGRQPWRRITVQLLTESALLALRRGAVGMLLAGWGTEVVARILRMGMRPILIDVQPDRDVMIFALLVSLVTGLAFGLAPAWKTTGVDLLRTLKSEGNARGSRLRCLGQKVVVVVQAALESRAGFWRGAPGPHVTEPQYDRRGLSQGWHRVVRARCERHGLPNRPAGNLVQGCSEPVKWRDPGFFRARAPR